MEVAFAGRSNVGKSSLINALTRRRALARTSNTPGRTQALVFFAPETDADEPPLALVDMPGYGYAKAPKAKVEAWTKLVFRYLRGRSTLRRAFLLVDTRHGLKDSDMDVMALLDSAAVTYQVVLTKADKPNAADVDRVRESVGRAIAKRPAAHPTLLETSSRTGHGIDELRAEIAALAAGG